MPTAVGEQTATPAGATAGGLRTRPSTLDGWGRFRPLRTTAVRPERPTELPALLSASGATLVARGLGRSYGDSAVDDQGITVLCGRIDRLLAFDPAGPSVTCEAGTSLEDLIHAFLPRGYFLPVTPGTKFVTVGGAIAADIHGKNHHRDGTFGNFVDSIDLLIASGDVLRCSRDEHPDLFRATLGGMGLTGIILRATIRLRPVETSRVVVDYRKAADLDAAFALFAEGDARYLYSVAWIDCLARGKALGRAILMRGDHARVDDLPRRDRRDPLALPRARHKTIPFDLPGFALNPLSVGAFNNLYYATHRDRAGVVTSYDSFFYPLDGINRWNRLYGKRGFIQYQALFPSESSHKGMKLLLEEITRSRIASFLAVLKSTGAAGEGTLSFPFPGHTLALDLPNIGRRLLDLTARLDRILLDHGGRLYLAKDAVMEPSTFAAMYGGQLPAFHAIKQRVDPESRFASAQARRLGLVPARPGS